MRRMMMTTAALGAMLALAGCSMAISRETRYQLHHAFANGSNANAQLGDVGFKSEKDLFYGLTPVHYQMQWVSPLVPHFIH